jgi:hypothetical protein
MLRPFRGRDSEVLVVHLRLMFTNPRVRHGVWRCRENKRSWRGTALSTSTLLDCLNFLPSTSAQVALLISYTYNRN